MKKTIIEYVELDKKIKMIRLGGISIYFTDIKFNDEDHYNLMSNNEHIADILKRDYVLKKVKNL